MIIFLVFTILILTGFLAHFIDRTNFRIDELERKLTATTANLSRLRRQLEVR